MNIENKYIKVNGLKVELVRKDIKHLHLGVYPPDGRVRVSAPLRYDNEAVRLAVITRLGWIKRKKADFKKQVRQSEREMVSGESHYYQGRRYRLKVIEKDARPSVRVRNKGTLELQVRPGADRTKREEVLSQWYRQKLKEAIPELIAKWEPVIEVSVSEWGVKKMKTRWGTCNIKARRIWLNLELAKKPSDCLEYIVVHEMGHFLERHHNDRYKEYMDKFLPKWRLQRDELKRAPLAHENWEY